MPACSYAAFAAATNNLPRASSLLHAADALDEVRGGLVGLACAVVGRTPVTAVRCGCACWSASRPVRARGGDDDGARVVTIAAVTRAQASGCLA